MARLLSVNVGLPRDVAWRGKIVHTGIWKQPAQGCRRVRRLNLEGDGQGDPGGLNFRPEALELGVLEIGIDEQCIVLARAQRAALACCRQRIGATLPEACETGCAHDRSFPISNPL